MTRTREGGRETVRTVSHIRVLHPFRPKVGVNCPLLCPTLTATVPIPTRPSPVCTQPHPVS